MNPRFYERILYQKSLIKISKIDCDEKEYFNPYWEVTYNCYGSEIIGGCGIDLSCGGSRTLQLPFCGEKLKDAKLGNTIIISQNACETKTMTFNRFVKAY